jgi:UDP-glucuronate 4-epimerase
LQPAIFAGTASISTVEKSGAVPPGTYKPTFSIPTAFYNIGSHRPVALSAFIACIEKSLGKKAIKNFLPMQAGDVPETYADVSDLVSATDFSPSTSIETGIERFISWHLSYYV